MRNIYLFLIMGTMFVGTLRAEPIEAVDTASELQNSYESNFENNQLNLENSASQHAVPGLLGTAVGSIARASVALARYFGLGFQKVVAAIAKLPDNIKMAASATAQALRNTGTALRQIGSAILTGTKDAGKLAGLTVVAIGSAAVDLAIASTISVKEAAERLAVALYGLGPKQVVIFSKAVALMGVDTAVMMADKIQLKAKEFKLGVDFAYNLVEKLNKYGPWSNTQYNDFITYGLEGLALLQPADFDSFINSGKRSGFKVALDDLKSKKAAGKPGIWSKFKTRLGFGQKPTTATPMAGEAEAEEAEGEE